MSISILNLQRSYKSVKEGTIQQLEILQRLRIINKIKVKKYKMAECLYLILINHCLCPAWGGGGGKVLEQVASLQMHQTLGS